MRLYWSTRSPFARKVTVTAHEKGVADRIVLEKVRVSASQANPDVLRDNPTGKIPTLILEDGSALFDSRVICEYLDAIGTGPILFPAGDARWPVLRQQALGDGLMEAIVQRMGEGRRPEDMRSEPHVRTYTQKMHAISDCLEAMSASLAASAVSIGAISIGCALAHLDFRCDDIAWRTGRPGLAAWHHGFSKRPSMLATVFRDEY
jgi:glutathione S-transferase